jgi:hypothetical protein
LHLPCKCRCCADRTRSHGVGRGYWKDAVGKVRARGLSAGEWRLEESVRMIWCVGKRQFEPAGQVRASAVNADGRFGTWRYQVIYDPAKTPEAVSKIVEKWA